MGRVKPTANRLTNESTYSILMAATKYVKASHAACVNTLHGSDPTLYTPVHGLQRIIRYRGTSVSCRFGGPTDRASLFGDAVWLGRFAVSVVGRA